MLLKYYMCSVECRDRSPLKSSGYGGPRPEASLHTFRPSTRFIACSLTGLLALPCVPLSRDWGLPPVSRMFRSTMPPTGAPGLFPQQSNAARKPSHACPHRTIRRCTAPWVLAVQIMDGQMCASGLCALPQTTGGWMSIRSTIGRLW